MVIAETEEDLIKRLNEWKDFVENRGTRVNINKSYGTMRHIHSGNNMHDTRGYKPQESLVNANVNARQHCVSLSCLGDEDSENIASERYENQHLR